MAKKAIFFLSAFLLFFCFGLVRAQEITNETSTSTPERQIMPISEIVATSTDILIAPLDNSNSKEAEINLAKNKEFSKECSLSKCSVPIATLKEPDKDSFYKVEKIYLTGLTWNNTLIDIYVDGNFIGQAVVNNDSKSNTANFYYQLDVSGFSIGEHKWSVIAWSPNGRDRSFVSEENIFTLSAVKVVDQKVISNVTNKEQENQESTSSISEQREDVGIVQSNQDGEVSISENKSDADVSVTSSEENNMLVVDKDKKSEESVNKSDDSDKLQNATPSEETKQEVAKDLDVNKNTDSNRKIGIILLTVLVFVVLLGVIVFKKKK